MTSPNDIQSTGQNLPCVSDLWALTGRCRTISPVCGGSGRATPPPAASRLVTALPGLARHWGPGSWRSPRPRVGSPGSFSGVGNFRVVPAPGATAGNTPQTTAVPPPGASAGSAQAWRSFKLERCPMHAFSWAYLPTPESSSDLTLRLVTSESCTATVTAVGRPGSSE